MKKREINTILSKHGQNLINLRVLDVGEHMHQFYLLLDLYNKSPTFSDEAHLFDMFRPS